MRVRRSRPGPTGITDPGGPNIDPVAQLGGRFAMRLHPKGDPAERRAARLTVCANAVDAADARLLFEALGLDKP